MARVSKIDNMAIYNSSGEQIIGDKYLSYFKKKHGCRVVRSRGQNLVSNLIDLDPDIHRSCNHIFQICINDSASSKLAIQSKESNVAILDEGLIATYPTLNVINHFRKTFQKEVRKELINSKFQNSNDELIDFVQMSDPDQSVSPIIEVCVPAKDREDQKRILKVMTDDFVKSGYFMTSYDTINREDFVEVYIQLEAKYTDMLVDVSDVLYHVAPLKLLHKIATKGLVPYSKSNNFAYPERVYMFNKCQKEIIYDYAQYKVTQSGDIGFCVFKIKKDVLLNDQLFKSGSQRVYLDPAFSMSGQTDQTALYTYGNVPLRVIDDEFCEVHLSRNGDIETEKMRSLKSILREIKVIKDVKRIEADQGMTVKM